MPGIARKIAVVIEARSPRDRPPYLSAFAHGAHRKIGDRIAHAEQKAKRAARTFGLFLNLVALQHENFGQRLADQFFERLAHFLRRGFAEIAQPPFGVSRPEPALPRIFIGFEDPDPLARVNPRGRATCRPARCASPQTFQQSTNCHRSILHAQRRNHRNSGLPHK